jgi:protein tyrosine phosphatase (PTP) superfamily phosphohydrolase (DUF442 family)
MQDDTNSKGTSLSKKRAKGEFHSPINKWEPSLGVGRAPRPGNNSSKANLAGAVDKWVNDIQAQGIQSVICLLSEDELDLYSQIPGGLLNRYRQLGLTVVSIPLPMDREPILTTEDKSSIAKAYEQLPKPLVVHCNVGIMRSGAALRHLLEMHVERRG